MGSRSRSAAEHSAVHDLLGVQHRRRAAALHPDLHDLVRGAHRLDHPPALLERMRHRLFEIHVLLRVERGQQHRAVVMVGRRDHDGVHTGRRQQFAIIHERLRVRRVLERQLRVGLVNIRHCDALRAQFLEVLVEIPAAPAGADQSICQPIARAPGATRHKKGSGHRGGQESPAVLFHGKAPSAA
jgi:hypothetical protein